MSVPEHLEKFLGPINQGWAWPDFKGLSAAQFTSQPGPTEQTICTIGFSRHILDMPNNRKVRAEFFLVVDHHIDPLPLANVILQFAVSFLSTHNAPLHGAAYGPHGEIVVGSGKTALYCSAPSIYPDDFATIEDTNPATVMVWIIPISTRELSFVRKFGWSRFEYLLEKGNTLVSNVFREDIRLS